MASEAIRLKPDARPGPRQLATLLGRKGLPDRAIDESASPSDSSRTIVDAHYNLGNALKAQAFRRRPSRSTERSSGSNGAYAEAHCNLGDLLRRQGGVPRGPGGGAPRP